LTTHFPSNRTLILVFLLTLGTTYYYFHLLLPRARLQESKIEMAGPYAFGGDFYPIWLTGRELISHRTNPYTQEMTRTIQTGLFGRPMDPRRPVDPPTEFRAFSYPLYADLLAAPVLPFKFDSVRLVLGFLLPVTAAYSVVLWLHAFKFHLSRRALSVAIILVLISYPVLEGLYALQVGVWVGIALAISTAAMARGRLFLAGMFLAFASVKPQLVWLLALWLMLWAVSDWKRRKVLALSFVLTLSILFLASQLLLPGWFVGWWRSLAGYSHYTLPPLAQLVLGRFPGAALELILLMVAIAICWRSRQQPVGSLDFSLALSFVLAASVMFMPTGGAVYDQVILLPAILWLCFQRAEIVKAALPIRIVGLSVLIALCWQWFGACTVVLISLFRPAWTSSPAVLVFPTRMAAPLPFTILALLSYFAVGSLRGKTSAGDSLKTVGPRVPG